MSLRSAACAAIRGIRSAADAPGRRAGRAVLVPATRLGGPMPWILAIMVALVMLGLGGSLAMHELARGASNDMANTATVQIVVADPSGRETQTGAAADLLRADPLVAGLRVVPQTELDALLEPWLGAGALEGNLVPVPALIDVTLAGPADEAALRRLGDRLAEAAPSARIDAQSTWLSPLLGAIRSLRYLAVCVVLLLAVTAVTAVWLAARSALAQNADTVEVVHLLGGDDRQIAAVFQRAVLPDAVAGSVVGAMLGAGALWLLGRQFSALEAGLVAGGGLPPGDWLALLAVPLAAVGTALLTVRLTILAALRKSL